MIRKLVLASALLAAVSVARASGETAIEFGDFGSVTVFRPAGVPKSVTLFVSGDGGFKQGVVDMARNLAALDSLVVGIDLPRYLKRTQAQDRKCVYLAGELEALSQYVQKRLELAEYKPPVLVGYSSGATLVYAALTQAPEGTFAGAVSLGFCPDLDVQKPLCRENQLLYTEGPKGKGIWLLPQPKLASPWRVLQGTIDQVCSPADTEKFVKEIPSARIAVLPKVGHGYSVPKNWLPQFREAFLDVAAAARATGAEESVARPPAPQPAAGVPAVDDLPLIIVPPSGTPADGLVVLLSGDGGWAGLDREVSTILAKRGYPVIGWNSLKYYWTPRTPEQASADLARILRHYLAVHSSTRVMLIGYSRGADVLPFLAARLPDELKKQISLVALVGIAKSVSFEFHVTDWLGSSPKDSRPTLPEVEKLRGIRVLCVQGDDERDTICPELKGDLVTVEVLKGGHHFSGDYEGVTSRILAAAGW